MTAILILGMHRSGTSALAGSLQQQGVYLDKVFEWNPHNLKGNRENAEIMALNDSVLLFSNGSWDNPPKKIGWTTDHAKTRNEIIAKFLSSNQPTWGFKDPRTLITLDFWLDGLQHISTKYVGSFRHPLLVANSLNTRNQLSIEAGLVLWDQYNTRLLDLQKKYRFPLVSFDVDFDEYQRTLQFVLSKFNIQPIRTTENLFFEKTLRHETLTESKILHPSIIELYNQLSNIYQAQFI